MSTDYGEGQTVNRSAVNGNDLPPFAGEGADACRQARSILFRSAAQIHQSASFRIHDAEETIGVAHTVMLVELRVCHQGRMSQVAGPWSPPVAANWTRRCR